MSPLEKSTYSGAMPLAVVVYMATQVSVRAAAVSRCARSCGGRERRRDPVALNERVVCLLLMTQVEGGAGRK